MSMPTFSAWPPFPNRSAPEADFDAKMYAIFQHFAGTHRNEMLAFINFLKTNSTVINGALNGTTVGLTVPAAARFTSITGDAVTQSNIDTTPGRLATVGWMGLGAESPPLISDFTQEMRPGFYRYSESIAIGAPGDGAAWWGTAIVSRLHASVGHTLVIATRLNQSAPRTWIGVRGGLTGALTWTELYHQRSVVGTVGQSAGVPTGAVIERGSNANGEYVRFADGTQICTVIDVDMGSVVAAGAGTFADPWRTDAVTNITWPAVFAAPPAVAPCVRLGGSGAVNPTARSLALQVTSSAGTTGWINLRAYRCSSDANAQNALLSVTATGRWY